MRLIKKSTLTDNDKDIGEKIIEELQKNEIVNVNVELLDSQGKVWGEFSQNKTNSFLTQDELDFLKKFNRNISIRFIYNYNEKDCTWGITSIDDNGEFHFFNYSPNEYDVVFPKVKEIISKIKSEHGNKIKEYVNGIFDKINA